MFVCMVKLAIDVSIIIAEHPSSHNSENGTENYGSKTQKYNKLTGFEPGAGDVAPSNLDICFCKWSEQVKNLTF